MNGNKPPTTFANFFTRRLAENPNVAAWDELTANQPCPPALEMGVLLKGLKPG